MNHRFKLTLLLLLAVMKSYGQEAQEAAMTNATLFGLLEFLGEFETEDGEWVDPDSLLEESLSELDEPDTADDEEE